VTFDVAVIGAGASGLCCAATLARHGASVAVFEAADRVGGRIRTGTTGAELGAQVVHGERNPLLALLGRAALPEEQAGSALQLTGGRLEPIERRRPWTAEEAITASPGPVTASVADWLAGHVPFAAARRAAAEWFRQNWAADPAELTQAGIAARCRAGAGAGVGRFTVAGGFSSLPERLAAGLDLRLNRPVRRIRWRPGRAELSVPGALGTAGTESARAVVVTVPPPVVTTGRLLIEGLPAGKTMAGQALALGDACCVVATLDRVAGENSVIFDADGNTGFTRSHAGSPDVLIVAKSGAASAVRAAVAGGSLPSLLAASLPWSSGAHVIATEAVDWGRDPWITGAFTFPRPGALWAPGRWARPVAGTLFFAGEATWTGGPPSVNGAMASGERAAGEVLAGWGACTQPRAEVTA